jgi:hypothetical protein
MAGLVPAIHVFGKHPHSPHPEEATRVAVSKDESVSRAHWTILRDAASRLLLRKRSVGWDAMKTWMAGSSPAMTW